MPIDRSSIRTKFPALASDDIFLDNAGGSQVPLVVADGIRNFMLGRYVQPGADYRTSTQATETVSMARDLASTLVNGRASGHVAFGASTSSLVSRLAGAHARAGLTARDEVVVAESGHEANVGPWARLADQGWKVRWWKLDPGRRTCPIDGLQELLGDRTRIVALPHVSNLLGQIEPLQEICRMAHAAGARVVADGVAYAPHRAIDVEQWDVDWYVYSTYKVYGPHMAVLWGKTEAFEEIEGPNHYFIPADEHVYKFELGGVPYESCAGLLALGDYLSFLAQVPPGKADPLSRETVEAAFRSMDELERPLTAELLIYLGQHPRITMVGSTIADDLRVPTISFVHKQKSSREIVLGANAVGLGIRYGHFYAHRLASALCDDPADGVVRTSLVHYNTPEEVTRLIDHFEGVL